MLNNGQIVDFNYSSLELHSNELKTRYIIYNVNIYLSKETPAEIKGKKSLKQCS